MALYDRNYTSDIGFEAERSENALVGFVKQTYKFFAASLFFGTIGAYIAMPFAPILAGGAMFGIFILEIALLFGLIFLKDKPIVNLILLFSFTFVTGVALVPLLANVLSLPAGVSIVAQALLGTTIVFGIMSLYAIKTKSDLSNWGKILFLALIGIIVASLINLAAAYFFGFGNAGLISVVISGIATIIFSMYIAYDTQNIIRGRYDSPIMAAISLYLDVYGLFVHLLNILGYVNKD
ncbi:Bax inhibitor-1/YccA family protein [Helicobacter sp. MIT 14-3879]|uniref:Bax inhibitor-1/YccA family protein n=1 Tax=Helicobacter sp. MIT 14-3879 TaxID=2040649 RepID=UPI000E1E725D|nr:Bax inhibitor-1/YccA family protein [Helicobacter sp. MIT 14-3879]RDU65658.1 BAX inhibitor (BI)-1/YccA family protein [Helicobacter sp. MIT 14-3879]